MYRRLLVLLWTVLLFLLPLRPPAVILADLCAFPTSRRYDETLELLRKRAESVAGQRGAFYVFGHIDYLALNTDYRIWSPSRVVVQHYWDFSPGTESLFGPPDQIIDDLERAQTRYVLDVKSEDVMHRPAFLAKWRNYLATTYSPDRVQPDLGWTLWRRQQQDHRGGVVDEEANRA